MRKIISYFFLLSLLIISCAPVVLTESTQSQNETQIAEPTATQSEALASPETFVAVTETPLPTEASAPLIDAPNIFNIEMIDTRNGWGITDNEIVRTDDGGVTWYNVTPSDLKEVGYSALPFFLDEQNAWIQFADNNNYPLSGFLYRTKDGGITWEKISTPFSSGDMRFLDENNGWILADLGVGAGSMAVSIFQTNDGGETWARVYTNDQNLDGASDTLPLGGLKVLLVPIDMQTAWVGGVVYSNGTVYMFRTDDGGKTWNSITNIELPQEAQESQVGVEKIKLISAKQAVLVLRMTSTNQETLMYITNDAGSTWQAFSESIPEAGLIEIPSAMEIVFYSSDQFYITQDGGATFNIVNSNIPFGDSLIDMSFVNAQVGWAIVTGSANQRTLYKTEDGAQTWFPIIP